MNILVIIVTYNAMRWAERCLNSLYSSNIIPDVFVVDNGSTDGTQDYIQNNFPNVIFQQSQVNLGFGKANNLGLQYAIKNNYDYVYLLNQDAWIKSETFNKILEAFNINPEYGILSPLQLQANEQFLDVDFNSGPCSFKNCPDLLSGLLLRKGDIVYEVPTVMAAHWMISRECAEKVGGFSPAFPHYGEDDNYTDRARFHGFKIGIVTNAIAIHDRGNRSTPRKKEIYLSRIRNIETLSAVSTKVSNRWLICLKESFRTCLNYKTVKPIIDLTILFLKRKKILKIRDASKRNGAFIN